MLTSRLPGETDDTADATAATSAASTPAGCSGNARVMAHIDRASPESRTNTVNSTRPQTVRKLS